MAPRRNVAVALVSVCVAATAIILWVDELDVYGDGGGGAWENDMGVNKRMLSPALTDATSADGIRTVTLEGYVRCRNRNGTREWTCADARTGDAEVEASIWCDPPSGGGGREPGTKCYSNRVHRNAFVEVAFRRAKEAPASSTAGDEAAVCRGKDAITGVPRGEWPCSTALGMLTGGRSLGIRHAGDLVLVSESSLRAPDKRQSSSNTSVYMATIVAISLTLVWVVNGDRRDRDGRRRSRSRSCSRSRSRSRSPSGERPKTVSAKAVESTAGSTEAKTEAVPEAADSST